jgi:hypothetical protein
MFNQRPYLMSDCSILPASCILEESTDSVEISFVLFDIIDRAKRERKYDGSYESFLGTIAEQINETGVLHYCEQSKLDFAPTQLLGQKVYVFSEEDYREYRHDPDLKVSSDDLMQIMLGNEPDVGFANALIYATIAVLYNNDTALCWSRCAA